MQNIAGIPPLVDVKDAYRGPYAARIAEFTKAGQNAGYTPAQGDRGRIALVLVDYQHDFVDPTGTLQVPGAQDDVARLLTWFYTNAYKITTIYASLDTHVPFSIFFSSWWQNPDTGAHPEPFTAITADDVLNKRWIPLFAPEWSANYVQQLAKQAKKDLMIWPHHTMEGTLGRMLVAPLSEAIAWHSAARSTQPVYITKGLTPRTEFYGIFGAEVPDPEDTNSTLNTSLIEAVMQHDRVYIAGEAKSHCVLETERQLVGHFAQQPEMLQRLYFLTDCASSVAHPEINFEILAGDELEKMGQMGVHLVTSREELR